MNFEKDVSKKFWREVLNTIVYTMNKFQVSKDTNMTPYEIQFCHSHIVKYLRNFESKCYIKREDDIGMFHARSDEGMFLGYSLKSKAYKCLNQRTKTIVESANVRVDEKFGIRERMLAYDSNGETNPKDNQENVELFYEIDTNLQNDIQIVDQRE